MNYPVKIGCNNDSMGATGSVLKHSLSSVQHSAYGK